MGVDSCVLGMKWRKRKGGSSYIYSTVAGKNASPSLVAVSRADVEIAKESKYK